MRESATTSNAGAPDEDPRIFISYSHDSDEHRQRVLDLATRLRQDDGLDVEIDRFHQAPPQGWPRWMHDQLREARFVLVVCTETYYRRAMMREAPGKGLGAIWEAQAINQELYESQGRNERFIPVVFGAEDVQYIPAFLRAYQRYDLSTPDGYDELYRLLTSQPAVPKPPRGQRRTLPPVTGAATPTPPATPAGSRSVAQPAPEHPLLLLRTPDGELHFTPLLDAEQRDELRLVVLPDTPATRGLIAGWVGNRFASPVLQVAFADTALTARIREVARRMEARGDVFELTLAPVESNGGGMEMGTTGYTADDLAELRARRILLDEPAPDSGRGGRGRHAGDMLDVLIAGLHSALPVGSSPLPELYRRTRAGAHTARFEELARLVITMWLLVTGTVEQVHELQLELRGDTLRVCFHGVRRRFYTNQPAAEIRVKGTCLLAP